MPFAPSVIDEFASEYFVASPECRYMTHAVDVRTNLRKMIPAVVHVDGTSRIHAVVKNENPVYYNLINAFYEITGIPMILNTSFNRSGEPIVDSQENAIDAFLALDIQYMTIDGILVRKQNLQCSVSNSFCEGLFIYPHDDAISKISKIMGHYKPLHVSKRSKFNLTSVHPETPVFKEG